MRRSGLLFAVGFLSAAACSGSSGGELVTFSAAVAGPTGVARGPLSFTNLAGYQVTLTKAMMHVGAIYMNRAVPRSGSEQTACVLPGIYDAEVTTPAGAPAGVDVDLLSGATTPFPDGGRGTSDVAFTGEVWLTGGDVYAEDDPTVLLEVAGTAAKGSLAFGFAGKVTIGKNRVVAPGDPSEPGSNPLCKARIVSPIPVDVAILSGGSLVVHVDPRALFRTVDFAVLPQVPSGAPGAVYFPDAPASGAANALFSAMHDASTYTFTFTR